MRSATRAGVHIDRAACAWLIRRHIDPDLEFVDAVLRGLSMVADGLSEHHGRALLLGRPPA